MDSINEIVSSYYWTKDVDNIFSIEHIPHFCIPSLNTCFENDVSFKQSRINVGSYNEIPFSISSSLPFGEPALMNSANINGFDPSMDLVHAKQKWENCKNKIILANLKLKGRQKCKKKDKSVKAVPSGVLKLAEHLDSDPDANFSNHYNYNWYYSGGSLNSISHSNNNFLLSTRYSTPGILHITPLSITEDDSIPSENEKLFLHTNKKQPIFQTVVKNRYVALRQKNNVSLFLFNKGKKLKFKKIHDIYAPDDSIVSAAISNNLDGEYCTLSTSQTLKIWSPESKDCVLSHKFDIDSGKELYDRWGYINYFSNQILFSTRNCLYLKDRRTNLNIDLKWWHPKTDGKCNYISFITSNNCNANTAYMGTKHNLLELDLRKTYTKEWTHMMEHAPMYSALCPVSDGSEVIFVGSQNINEACLIELNNKSMPFILPSPNDMIRDAKFHGMCLDPIMTTRCNFGMTGLTSIPFVDKNCSGIYIFRSTSIGDIFYQKAVYKNNMLNVSENDESNINNSFDKNVFSAWEERCSGTVENIENQQLLVTDAVNKIKTYISLNKESSKRQLNLIKEQYDRKEKDCNGTWNISKRKLMEEKEPFAQCLLDVWDIEDENEWYKPRKRTKKDLIDEEKTDYNSKIEAWFSHLPEENVNGIEKGKGSTTNNCVDIKSSTTIMNQDLPFPSTSKITSTPNHNPLNIFSK